MKKLFFLLTMFLLVGSFTKTQVELPRISPNASVSETIGYTIVTVNYCRPAVKERKIWDGLVPFNKVWRTGANEATTIQFTTDVTVEATLSEAEVNAIQDEAEAKGKADWKMDLEIKDQAGEVCCLLQGVWQLRKWK